MSIVGFFIALFGMLFCGVLSPVQYEDIYNNHGLALLSGIMSVSRYFIESLTVQELRYLPEQSGFSVHPTSVYFPYNQTGSFAIRGLAQNDLSVIRRTRDGWYWGVLPAFMVGLSVRFLGLGALHAFDRSRQNKKSLWFELMKDPLYRNRTFYYMIAYLVMVVVLFGASGWFILSITGETGIDAKPEDPDAMASLANKTLEMISPVD